MSIYSSRFHVGDRDHAEDSHPGTVAAYQGSHLYDPGDYYCSIDTADVPSYCVPGRQDRDIEGEVGQWLRLSVTTPDHDVTVLIDHTAAVALRDELDAWIGVDKISKGDT